MKKSVAAIVMLALTTTPALAGVKLGTSLSGSAGGGTFAGDLDVEAKKICYTLDVGSTAGLAAHIHVGAVGETGSVVVPLSITGSGPEKCAEASEDALKAIVGNPGAYYVNVHTKEAPAGGMRGQLSRQ